MQALAFREECSDIPTMLVVLTKKIKMKTTNMAGMSFVQLFYSLGNDCNSASIGSKDKDSLHNRCMTEWYSNDSSFTEMDMERHTFYHENAAFFQKNGQ